MSTMQEKEKLEEEFEVFKANHDNLLKAKDDEINRLKEQLAAMRNDKYGTHSEKMDSIMKDAINEPEEIFDHHDESQPIDVEWADDIIKPRKLPKGKASKAGIPKTAHLKNEDIVVEEVHHPFDEDFLKDHPDAVQTDAYIWEELIRIPSQIKIIRHIVDQVVLKDTQTSDGSSCTLKNPEAPKPLFDRSLASPSLIANMVSNKYLNALPISRQCAQLERDGIEITKQVASNWIIKAWEIYGSLVFKAMHEDFKKAEVVHGDETTFPCLQARREEGRKQSYLMQGATGKWESKQMVLFFYKRSREGSFVEEIFGEGHPGRILHSDAYKPYFGKDFTNIACMDHIRRGFVQALKTRDTELKEYRRLAREKDEEVRKANLAAFLGDKKHAVFARLIRILKLISRLYQYEAQFTKKDLTPEQIQEQRQKLSRPVFQQLVEEVEPLVSEKVKEEVKAKESGVKPKRSKGKNKPAVKSMPPKTKAVEAANYFWKLKMYGDNFLNNGRAVISNQRAENGMRSVALLRKNSYFFDTDHGGDAGAGWMSLIKSAQVNHLNPEDYVEYMLCQLKDNNYSKELVQQLLPYNGEIAEKLKSFRAEKEASGKIQAQS